CKETWGTLCADATSACTPQSCFRLASVSKQFTAAAILRLVEQDRLRLDDPLSKFFPESPTFWRTINIHHLLTHTSGLADYENLIPHEQRLQLTDGNVLNLLLDVNQPNFPPGSKFAYSNSGYALLGLIVEIASQRPFPVFAREAVFGPVGMPSAQLYLRGLSRPSERVYGYRRDGDAWEFADQSATSAVLGDGGVYASLDDLQAWLLALDRGEALAPESLKLMFHPHVVSDRSDDAGGYDAYGYGWFVGRRRGQTVYLHAGSTCGFSLMVQRFPERRGAVALLLNQYRNDATDAFVEQVVETLLP
ncbi:MAG: beta-lactamase family protein, partial [Planctomycetales bacterium]|nr:beta-lactamase family protein [Planctomycetales bacterium]